MRMTRRQLLSGLGLSMLGVVSARADEKKGGGLTEAIWQIAGDERALFALTTMGVWHLDGSSAHLVAKEPGARWPLLVGEQLYFIAGAGRICSVPLRGGDVRQVADCGRNVHHVVRDATHLYLSIADTRSVTEGRAAPARPGLLVRALLGGGAIEQLGEHSSALPRLAIDEECVYLTTQDGVSFVDKKTKILQPLKTSQAANGAATAIAVLDHRVYTLTKDVLRELDTRTGAVRVLHRGSVLVDVAVGGDSVYVVRNTTALGPGLPPRAGALLAISRSTGAVRTLAEPLAYPQQVVLGKDVAYVRESELFTKTPGTSQVKRIALA